jgi:hypothetical protein
MNEDDDNNNNNNKNESYLDSLVFYEELRIQNDDNIREREENSVLDLLQEPIIIDGKESVVGFCHMVGISTFIDPSAEGDEKYYVLGYEAAIGTVLAVQHLNSGDGSIIREASRLNEKCPIRFTLQFIGADFDDSKAVGDVLEVLDHAPRKPSAFIGGLRSAVSAPTSLITGLYNYPQISGASTSIALDDKDSFPYFARTIPSDNASAESLILFVTQKFGLKHLAVVNMNNVSTELFFVFFLFSFLFIYLFILGNSHSFPSYHI